MITHTEGIKVFGRWLIGSKIPNCDPDLCYSDPFKDSGWAFPVALTDKQFEDAITAMKDRGACV